MRSLCPTADRSWDLVCQVRRTVPRPRGLADTGGGWCGTMKVDHEKKTIYLFGPGEPIESEWCHGKVVIAPLIPYKDSPEFKHHCISVKTSRDYIWSAYVPLPKDKEHLELFLREIAEAEGIDLSQPA